VIVLTSEFLVYRRGKNVEYVFFVLYKLSQPLDLGIYLVVNMIHQLVNFTPHWHLELLI
jgi:hypothetical protein